MPNRAFARRARPRDPAAEVGPLHLHAAGVRLGGDYDAARDLYLESLALADRLGNERIEQMEYHNLGWVELHRGDPDSAARMFAERDARSGLDAYGDAWSELNAAAIALGRGDRARAVSQFEAGTKKLLQEVMRGPSEWSAAERELFAAFVSSQRQCPF